VSSFLTISPEHPVIMADFHYGGTDEESAEIKKLNAEIVSYLAEVDSLARS
jgi:hypothetical protein